MPATEQRDPQERYDPSTSTNTSLTPPLTPEVDNAGWDANPAADSADDTWPETRTGRDMGARSPAADSADDASPDGGTG